MTTSKNSQTFQVRCHVHGQPIKAACHLDSCILHTNFPRVNKCMLVYLAKHDMKSLKPIDISMLKGIPEAQVMKTLAKSLTALRGNTLKASSHTSEIEKKFITLAGRDVCYNCERAITPRMRKNSSHVKIPKSTEKVWYCSSECQEQHPVQWVAVEEASKSDIKTILAWAAKRYSTLGGLEQALGMNRKLLGYSLSSLLGINANDLYPTTKRVKTRSKSLVRRTGSKPEWLTSFYSSMKPLRKAMELKYGPTEMDLTALKAKMDEVIRTI